MSFHRRDPLNFATVRGTKSIHTNISMGYLKMDTRLAKNEKKERETMLIGHHMLHMLQTSRKTCSTFVIFMFVFLFFKRLFYPCFVVLTDNVNHT